MTVKNGFGKNSTDELKAKLQAIAEKVDAIEKREFDYVRDTYYQMSDAIGADEFDTVIIDRAWHAKHNVTAPRLVGWLDEVIKAAQENLDSDTGHDIRGYWKNYHQDSSGNRMKGFGIL